MSERLGIFGGTFSPPHAGHVASAAAFAVQAHLDRLLVMPAFVPPHKVGDGVSFEHRAAMCRLAFSCLPEVTVSDLERRLGGTSYTYRTLETLTAPDRKLCLFCGTDMLLTLCSWRCPERIFELAEIWYHRREEDPQITEEIAGKCRFYTEQYGAVVHPIEGPVIVVSSSELRERLNCGESTAGLLDPAVERYIASWNLYRK